MMNTYEEAMFQFLTESETAFMNLSLIQKNYQPVREHLIQTFWGVVERELRQRYVDSDWQLVRIEPLGSRSSKLMLYKKHWERLKNGCPVMAVSMERLSNDSFYGPFIHRNIDRLDHSKALVAFRSLPPAVIGRYEQDNETWYPFFDFTGLDLAKDEGLLRILPVNRDETARDMADLFQELITALEVGMDRIYDDCSLTHAA